MYKMEISKISASIYKLNNRTYSFYVHLFFPVWKHRFNLPFILVLQIEKKKYIFYSRSILFELVLNRFHELVDRTVR